ncbi:hypothetical protein LTS18_012382 [Coniosporium uncinatum]|uniref:Uncharacterized protein n=1 Tax=Coniosporium uncinatum TaxID=93489 RepID=A0ACC3DYG9_9PEZI|nr:hypothetical protein LTS18_012382 [Coniosporium uncinatum]
MHYALLPPPGKNWPQAFHKRHPELKPKKVKALDWNRHDNNIYDKITHWFEVIGKELCDPVIAPENVYNMDETGVMLSMLGSIKVLVVGKEHVTSLYSCARDKALTSKNSKAGWIKAGLYPINPDRVLRDIQKPLAELTIPNADEVVRSCPQGEVLRTPVTAEGLTSLRLIEQDAHMLDETSKQRLQKLANAAQVSFAECALLLD